MVVGKMDGVVVCEDAAAVVEDASLEVEEVEGSTEACSSERKALSSASACSSRVTLVGLSFTSRGLAGGCEDVGTGSGVGSDGLVTGVCGSDRHHQPIVLVWGEKDRCWVVLYRWVESRMRATENSADSAQ